MTIKIYCYEKQLFNTWSFWVIEFECDESSCIADLEQEDFDNFTERLYKWIQAYKHMDRKYIKHKRLDFYVKDDIKHVINELLTECKLNKVIMY